MAEQGGQEEHNLHLPKPLSQLSGNARYKKADKDYLSMGLIGGNEGS